MTCGTDLQNSAEPLRYLFFGKNLELGDWDTESLGHGAEVRSVEAYYAAKGMVAGRLN